MNQKELEFAQKLQKHLEDTTKKMEYYLNSLKEFFEEVYLKH